MEIMTAQCHDASDSYRDAIPGYGRWGTAPSCEYISQVQLHTNHGPVNLLLSTKGVCPSILGPLEDVWAATTACATLDRPSPPKVTTLTL